MFLNPSPAQAISHPSTAPGGVRGGWYDHPLAVSPLIELELRGKKRGCRSPRYEEIDV